MDDMGGFFEGLCMSLVEFGAFWTAQIFVRIEEVRKGKGKFR